MPRRWGMITHILTEAADIAIDTFFEKVSVSKTFIHRLRNRSLISVCVRLELEAIQPYTYWGLLSYNLIRLSLG